MEREDTYKYIYIHRKSRVTFCQYMKNRYSRKIKNIVPELHVAVVDYREDMTDTELQRDICRILDLPLKTRFTLKRNNKNVPVTVPCLKNKETYTFHEL